MNFLNLNLAELLGMAGAISAGVVALYLLDKSKRKQVVATLRFWTTADVRTQLQRRRRVQQPWSLILQLLSIAMLLIAIAGPRWGGENGLSREHVLLVDTSAWMGARVRVGNVNATLLDQAKAAARAYIRALPSTDRVMIVRADALATPVTAFESNRQVLDDAIRRSLPSASKLNLEQAFEFAERAQKAQAGKPGEIVFAGAGRVSEEEAALATVPKNLRILPVAGSPENVGLRKIGLRRSPADPDAWEIYTAVHNYGAKVRTVDLALQFGGAPAGSKRMTVRPGTEEQLSFTLRTKAAGYLEARIRSADGPADSFPQDDRAVVELPPQKALRVVTYSADPESLRALIAANPRVEAVFEDPSKYDPKVQADIVVLDRFAPMVKPQRDSIWIEPPPNGSPIPARAGKAPVKLTGWRTDSMLGGGLRTNDVELARAEIFTPAAGDITVAESAEGPLVVGRPGTPRIVVIGFHPVRSAMKYELATPLLMANIMRWIAPETFRRWDVQAGTVGTVNVALDNGTKADSIRVLTDKQVPLPFTVAQDNLRFFAGAPATVRVLTGDRETVYSLTLPDVAEAAWKPPQGVRRGLPKASEQGGSAVDLWPWFAVLGGLGLLVDWLLFGRSRAVRLRAVRMAGAMFGKAAWRKAS